MKIGENAKKSIRTIAVFAVFVLLVLAAVLLPCLLDNAEKSGVKSSLIEYTDYSAAEPKTAEVCGTELVNLEGDCNSVLYVNHTPDEFVNPFPTGFREKSNGWMPSHPRLRGRSNSSFST